MFPTCKPLEFSNSTMIKMVHGAQIYEQIFRFDMIYIHVALTNTPMMTEKNHIGRTEVTQW